MINDKKVLAIIPARGGSKGLPGKNIKELCGKPLIAWPIQAAKNSLYIDKIILSTDELQIADIAIQEGAEVPFLRPGELASDDSTTISVIVHTINYLSEIGEIFDYCILLEPTSPLTEGCDINKSLELLESMRTKADSIVGVSKVVSTHPVFDVKINQEGLIKPYIGEDFSGAGRRQDIEELYFFEGSLYISDVKTLLAKQTFYHSRTLPYIVPNWKAFEVDDMVDLLCIEAIMKNMDLIKGKN
jgi:CMP-N,N'-diacetyllegionaminic acid synthase